MSGLAKIAAVLAGYVVALVIGGGVVYLRELETQGPDAQASAGMYAFGDAILFAAVFGAVALLPTGLALYFLRPVRAFWTALSIAASTLAVAGIAAVSVMRFASAQPPDDTLWAFTVFLGFVLLSVAPLLAAAFLMSSFIAPTRASRWVLACAAIIEAVLGAPAFLWFASHRLL
jgi:hypothetical protein